MKKIILTGGTGFIGISLAKFLKEKGFHPVLIARNKPKENFDFEQWDGINLGSWTKVLENAIAIVNLAGKSVNCIKTPDNCDLILRSRVETTKLIGQALYKTKNPPKTWIQMSTAHIYGDPPNQICTENSATGYGLAPFVGKAWEETFLKYLPKNIRAIRLRTGFVIGKNGGAMQHFKEVVRLGLGAKVGHGKQGMSWIHQEDLNRFILQAILQDNFKGIYNLCSPNPVSHQIFMKTLRKKMKFPFGISLPLWATKFGAKYIYKTDPELAIYGRYVISERLEQEGFQFQFPKLETALDNLI